MRTGLPSVRVSPILRLPWLGMPMMSPGQASRRGCARGREKHQGLHRHVSAGADVLQFHAALETARGEPHKGDAVAVLRVDVGLHLEDETGNPRLLGRDWPGGRPAAGAAPGPIRRPQPIVRAPRNCSARCRNRPASDGPRYRPARRRAGTAPSPSRPPRAIWRALLSATAAPVSDRRDRCSGPAR